MLFHVENDQRHMNENSFGFGQFWCQLFVVFPGRTTLKQTKQLLRQLQESRVDLKVNLVHIPVTNDLDILGIVTMWGLHPSRTPNESKLSTPKSIS